MVLKFYPKRKKSVTNYFFYTGFYNFLHINCYIIIISFRLFQTEIKILQTGVKIIYNYKIRL